jgi:hypothetical protein
MFLGLTILQLFGLTVLAAIISTLGSLFGIFLKDYLFSRSFDNWRQKKSLEQLYQKFRDPLLLSARELCTRLIEVMNEYPTCYLKNNVLQLNPKQTVTNNIDDPYFQRYKLVSTIYRQCSFFGWLELYRQEIVFLYSGNNRHSKRLEETIAKIRSDLADGQLNKAEDWPEWKDTLIFREELRAIGESMLEAHGSSRAVIGYGKFCDIFSSGPGNHANQWIFIVLKLFLDLEENHDFRKIRLARLVTHLIELMELLDKNKLAEYFSDARTQYASLSSDE